MLEEQDKQWIVTALERYLERSATKEDLKPFATKADLERVATNLERFATKEDLKRFATKEDLKLFATKEDLKLFATKEDLELFATKEDLERVETNLLTEFHKWSSPLEQRLRTYGAAMRALDLEMEALQDRVKDLERGNNQPRQQ